MTHHADRPFTIFHLHVPTIKHTKYIFHYNELPNSDEFQQAHFLTVKKLTDAKGCLEGWNSALIYQKHCGLP